MDPFQGRLASLEEEVRSDGFGKIVARLYI